MPRRKKTKRDGYHYEKIHFAEMCGYKIGEHVIIVGKGDDPKKFVVKIVDLFETDAGERKFTAKYYYYPSDLPKEFLRSIPRKCVEREIFLSNFTADNSIGAIVAKCKVFNAPDEKLISSSYVCRYQFFPWNASQPFTALVAASPRALDAGQEGKRPIGPAFQATIPKLEARRLSAETVTELDLSTQIWSCTASTQVAIETYLFLIRCAQLAVGNYVFAWISEIREEVRCIVLDHIRGGGILLRFGDDSGQVVVHYRFLRGLIDEDEGLEILYRHGLPDQSDFNYPNALLDFVSIFLKRSAELKQQINSIQIETSPVVDQPERKKGKRKTRGVRKASVLALERIQQNSN